MYLNLGGATTLRSMGWDIDRFPEGEVNLELICCICTCILEDPVESPCRHVFCSQCIKTWLSNQKSCPHCRAAVHKRDLQSVVPLLKNIISKQRIFCDNKERGCPEIVPLESLVSHVAVCQHGLVSCSNDGCHTKIMRKDLKAHSEVCLKRTVLCEDGCDMFLKLGERNNHNCVQSLRAHFQEVQNEMLTRISKLEELVNVLVSKNGVNPPRSLSRSNNMAAQETYNCVPYRIPSPHRSYESRPPPYTVFPDEDVSATINLTGYSIENHEFSDSVESVESDNVVSDALQRVARRQRDSSNEREMSPVYDHLDRNNRSHFHVSREERRRDVHRERQRSRSPHSRRPLDTTYTRNRVSNSYRVERENRDNRDNRVERQNRTYDYNERQNRRQTDGSHNGQDEQPLVLRIGVSQTVSDSSSSSSSSDTDTD